MTRGFSALHPFVLLLFYILAMIFIMYYQEIIFLTVVSCIIVIINLLLDKGFQLRKWLKTLFIMGVFIIIFTPIFNHVGTTILFYLFSWAITWQAILQGIILALTLVNMMMLFITFNLTLTNNKLLFLFGKVFPKWALLTMLSIRFVPLLKDRLTEIEEVQRFKNNTIGKQSFQSNLQNGMVQIQILLSWSLEESIQTADSMDARGYGIGKRSKYHRYRMEFRDWFVLSLLLFVSSLFLLSVYEVYLFSGVLGLRTTKFIIKTVIVCLFSLPIVLEGKEVVKWRLYLSKI